MGDDYKLQTDKSFDAIDEDQLILCFACCCANLSCLTKPDCMGCSGKIGLCCINAEMCCKPNAPCLPLICCGPKCEVEGCSCLRAQVHCCCCVLSAAIPCSEEVPLAVTIAGLTIYPFTQTGCCKKVGEIKGFDMDRS